MSESKYPCASSYRGGYAEAAAEAAAAEPSVGRSDDLWSGAPLSHRRCCAGDHRCKPRGLRRRERDGERRAWPVGRLPCSRAAATGTTAVNEDKQWTWEAMETEERGTPGPRRMLQLLLLLLCWRHTLPKWIDR